MYFTSAKIYGETQNTQVFTDLIKDIILRDIVLNKKYTLTIYY